MVTNRDRKSFRSRRAEKKFQKLLRRLAPLTFRHFGIHFSEIFRMSKSSWVMDPIYWHEMPSCSAIDLAEIRRSSKISPWIWSIFSGVVTALGRPGRGASQVEKSQRLKWATKFLTVEYDGALCLMFLWECLNFLRRLALQERKLDDSSRPDVAFERRNGKFIY